MGWICGILLFAGCTSSHAGVPAARVAAQAGEIAANAIGGQTANGGESALPMFPTQTYTLTVQLPKGLTTALTSLSVVDSLESVTPTAAGRVTIASYTMGPQVVLVLSPKGNPMLMGWLDSTHTAINASTTAQVLAYQALGGYLLESQAERNALEADILKSNELSALASVVSAELEKNVDAFATTDSELAAAVEAFCSATVSNFPKADDITISPGSQSGLNVIQLPPFQAQVTNSYRRRTHAFVERVSDVPESDGVQYPVAVTDFEVAPVVGVNGGVTGTISDIFQASFGNKPTAYADTTSDPFDIPLTSGAKRSNYQVTIVGPGLGNAGMIPSLSSAQQTSLLQVSVKGYITDALVPFMANFAFGSGFLVGPKNPLGTNGSEFKTALLNNVENDFLGFLPSVPGLQDMMMRGDWKGASTLLFTNAANAASLRVLLGKAVEETVAAIDKHVGSDWKPGNLTTAMNKFNTVVNAAGGLLQIFDSAVYSAELSNSDAVSKWDVTVIPTKVTLNPASSSIAAAQTASFKATVPSVENTTGYSYNWSTTGSYGTLTGSGGTKQKSFCASSATVTYTPNDDISSKEKSVEDTVTVQVYNGPNCKAKGSTGQLGQATGTVTIDLATLSASVNPSSVTMVVSQSAPTVQNFTGKFTGAKSSTVYSYYWTLWGQWAGLTGPNGSTSGSNLSSAGNMLWVCSPTANATFTAENGTFPGTYKLNLSIMKGAGCLGDPVVTATPAQIKIPSYTIILP
jgi:hypothetical protein